MVDHQKAISDAAAVLLEAITAAKADGYRVDFPDYALRSVAVSETKAVDTNLTFSVPAAPPAASDVPAPMPQTLGGRRGSAPAGSITPASDTPA